MQIKPTNKVRVSPGYSADLIARGINTFGMSELEALQAEMFHRNTAPGVDDRMVINQPDGVLLVYFTCVNFGMRDYDAGDYMVREATHVQLVEG